ncbi:hypothetical protein [Hymenobacter nivis]|uniref:Uncharacterized protein n=1 Tax=Hymenobacter nivis TaxID=1850093 RepID=A0A502HCI9_9BACT|nr:hypothetical protein [Hymenobacter nivis]TPG72377.1 hypothetical protein EAH73_03885 [Hymenobacter nivis]
MRHSNTWLPGALLFLGTAGFASQAQAQVLPIPGARNPDWALETTVPDAYRHAPGNLPVTTDRMPNASQRSVLSNGNRSYHWDAARQLAYEWPSHTSTLGPQNSVTVRDDRTGTTYTYGRRAPRPAARQWHRLPGVPK